MKSEEVARIIDFAADAVDKSKFGPIFTYPDQNDFTRKQVNQLAFGIYMNVLTATLNHHFVVSREVASGKILKDPNI